MRVKREWASNLHIQILLNQIYMYTIPNDHQFRLGFLGKFLFPWLLVLNSFIAINVSCHL